jgi:eukaryotic-like serine/threonine-protein kinase
VRKPILFGKYYLLERINVGGMAEVFKAKATGVEGFERLVAVKRILPNIAEDNEFIEMFVDEAKIAVQLTHANIAQIFDLGKVGDSYFIALEYVHGKDLRAVFHRARNRGEPVPISLASFVIMKVCEALDYAHNKKDATGKPLHFVHRDVSPQNMLISYEGEVKVIDFGIAKAAGKASKTRAGILKGKFGYMSPEQVKGLDIDRRSDVFGVGICLYELLTGERLFAGESDFSTVEKVRNVDIMPPSTYNRRIPEELEQIVLKALAGDVEERYQTAMELHDELESFTYTSGNTYSRKDLSMYMRKVFAEELAQESARDQKYQALMMSDLSKGEDLGTLDSLDSELTAREAPYANPSGQPRVAQGGTLRPAAPVNAPVSAPVSQPSTDDSQKLRIPYQRFNTLTGIPSIDQKQPMRLGEEEQTAPPSRPVVPPLVPRPQSIPPSFDRDPMPPTRLGMDWDDEDLSTQIYDKPDRNQSSDLFPPESAFDKSPLDARSTTSKGFPRTGLESPRPTADSGLTPSAQRQAALAPAYSPPIRTPAVVPDFQRPIQQRSSSEEFTPMTLSQADAPEPMRLQKAALRQRNKLIITSAILLIAIVGVVAVVVKAMVFSDAATRGMIHLTTLPRDALVKLDDRVISGSSSPFLINDITPGVKHVLEVSKNGYETWSLEVVVKPKELKRINAITLRPARSGFVLDSKPTGARVFVDGIELAQTTPVEATAIPPGPHRIRVENGDLFHPWEISVNIVAGTVLELPPARLMPTEPAPAPEPKTPVRTPGTQRKTGVPRIKTAPVRSEPKVQNSSIMLADGKLRINSRPWSEVWVDGKLIGNTPQMDIPLKPGQHQVILMNPGFNVRKTLSVDIRPGEITTKVVTLLPGQ